MKLENQVCTPEQGKRLRELGIEQFISLACYSVFCPDPTGERYFHEIILRGIETSIPDEHICDVFTVAELGAMLPLLSISAKQKITSLGWACMILNENNNDVNYKYDIHRGNTEAQARASMLIYLLENKLITAEECNNRLKNS